MTIKRYLAFSIPAFLIVATGLCWQDMSVKHRLMIELLGVVLGYAAATLTALWCVVRVVRHAWK